MPKNVLLAVLTAAALTASLAEGQWLETSIFLPDSFSGAVWPNILLTVPTESMVLVGNVDDNRGNSLVAYNTRAGCKYARIPVPGGVRAMCASPASGKVYCASAETVAVIDTRSSRVVRLVSIGARVHDVCYNPEVDRVYCAVSDPPQVVVLDGQNDSILTRIGMASSPKLLCCAPVENRVYVAMRSVSPSLCAIECAGDSVVRPVPVADADLSQMLYNAASRKLYCLDDRSGAVVIVDCRGDTVIGRVSVISAKSMCLNTRDNMLYVDDWNRQRIVAISCTSDTITASIPGPEQTRCVAYDSVDNAVFVTSDFAPVAVIDCATNAIIDSVRGLEGGLPILDYDPVTNRLFTLDDDLIAIDGATREVVDRETLFFCPYSAAYSSTSRTLYCQGDFDSEHGALQVIDGVTRVPTKTLALGHYPYVLSYASVVDKLYCGDRDTVRVVDCHSDSVLASIGPASWLYEMLYNPDRNRLYLGGGSALRVIDCAGDTFLPPITLRLGGPEVLGYSTRGRKLYMGHRGTGYVTVLDAVADTAVAFLDLRGQPTAWCYVSSLDLMCCAIAFGTARVVAIDGTTNQPAALVPVGDRPSSLVYSRRSNKLLTADYLGRTVTVIDCATMTRQATIPVDSNPNWLAYDSIADKVYCVHGFDGPVTAIDVRTNAIIAELAVGAGTRPPVWDPATRSLYVPGNHSSSVSVIRDTAVAGMEEGGLPQARGRKLAPTVYRNVLMLPEAAGGERSAVGACLLDISGRKVLDLLPGPNDVRGLAPGVYFIREPSAGSGKPSAVTKVVITR